MSFTFNLQFSNTASKVLRSVVYLHRICPMPQMTSLFSPQRSLTQTDGRTHRHTLITLNSPIVSYRIISPMTCIALYMI